MEGGFIGSEVILAQLQNRPTNRRVGIVSTSKRPIRQGAIVCDMNGKKIGHVTSGAPSPQRKGYIAMGYVPRNLSKQGTKLQLQVRNTTLDATVVKLPFVPSQYYTR